MIIYKITNNVNNKVYVGQTVQNPQKRISRHLHDVEYGSTTYFHNAIRKHGYNNFTHTIIDDTCQTKEDLDEMEFHYIKQYHSHYTEYGYNMTYGGDGNSLYGSDNPMYGRKRTSNEKKLMSVNRKGKATGNDNATVITAGVYELTFPDGHIEVIQNIRRFCRNNNLSHSPFYAMCNGRRNTLYKGYWCKRLQHSHQQLKMMGVL